VISNTLGQTDNPLPISGDANVVGANNDTDVTDYANAQTDPWALTTMGAGGGHAAVPFTP